ncbi:MAG: hypothetical protein IJB32_00555 [Clostridia bacterium]|nr:hypothetical protein [Clostridia bacterium]
MEKDLELTELFELYQGLLTDKQRELFSSYYLYDLSLSEIAEPLGTTRQSVYEGVKKVKNKLIEYEKLLKLKEKNDDLKGVAESLREKDDTLFEKILEIIGR